jgi:glycosyltransferase involved in cell wall biosynthesis
MTGNGLSSVVVTYNRIDVVETCLRSARIAGELIVVDKGSTDGTAEVGKRLADKFIQVPWSPTVEETRSQAMSLATSSWILSLDDDECLNVKAMELILSAVENPRGSIYYFPFRHHILGRHEERGYYWPEYRPALFRSGAIRFTDVVHDGVHPTTDEVVRIDPGTGAAIMHLSHKDAATWIEKTNRYTSRPKRAGSAKTADLTPSGIMSLMNNYMSIVPADDPDGYLTAIFALRGLYDVVDSIKRWESEQAQSGAEIFAKICTALNKDYDAFFLDHRPSRTQTA